MLPDTSYKVHLLPTMRGQNNMAAVTLLTLKTAVSLWLVTSHLQTVGYNKQFVSEVGKDLGFPESTPA